MNLHDQVMKEKLYRAQRGRCNAPCVDYAQRSGIFLPERLLECDHIDSNGPDGIENRQLLCSHCNRVKRDQPMEYLMNYHRKRWEQERRKREQLTIFWPERVVKKRRAEQWPVPQRRPKPQYMHPALVAGMAGVLLLSG